MAALTVTARSQTRGRGGVEEARGEEEEEKDDDTGRIQQSLSRGVVMTSEEQREASHHAGTWCRLPVRWDAELTERHSE